MSDTYLNLSNILNLLRLSLIFLIIWFTPRRPILSCFLMWLAGVVDTLDGPITRHFNQNSKAGLLSDLGMDRLTSSIQFFYLASKINKFWSYFLLIQFVEIFRDVCFNYLRGYRHLVTVLKLFSIDNNQQIIKTELLRRSNEYSVNFNTQKISVIQGVITGEPDSIWIENIYKLIWYTSDIFFHSIFYNIHRESTCIQPI